jgi:sucrose-6-phosphate hydrolase SacC (GH32 family)
MAVAVAFGGEIRNGGFDDYAVRPDVDGHHVAAHHGGVIVAEGRYWWYGQTFRKLPQKDGAAATDVGVVMYSSEDLLKWKNEGVVLSVTGEGERAGPLRFERPKIIHNQKTGRYVLWCHYVGKPGSHGVYVGTADAGVASCDKINSDYTWHGIQRPAGKNATVKDSTLFQETNGDAYFVFDSYAVDENGRKEPRCIYIAKLSDDYLTTTEVRRISEARGREAPALIKRGDYYFLFTSGCSGWQPNKGKVQRARSIWGPYEDLGNFAAGEKAEITFNAQSTYVFELHGQPGSFVFMGDRWNMTDMSRSAHIWLPLEFPTKDTVQLRYFEQWDLTNGSLSNTARALDLSKVASPVLLRGDDTHAYRDPAVIYHDGVFHLFYSYNPPPDPDGKVYWFTAVSTSRDLVNWTEPRLLTPKDQRLNFSSPGNVVRFGNEWIMCLQTYPTPGAHKDGPVRYGDETARIFIMRSTNLLDWSAPELLRVKGPDVPVEKMGRMIDPCLIEDRNEPGKWWCFFKQNGASRAWSRDLKTWTYAGHFPCGENTCVIADGDEYVLFHSPGNGVGIKRSKDLLNWRDEVLLTLGQRAWPWARNGRLTAGFVLDLRGDPAAGKALMFFHASAVSEKNPLGFWANCSIGLAWSDNLKNWSWPGKSGSSTGDLQQR